MYYRSDSWKHNWVFTLAYDVHFNRDTGERALLHVSANFYSDTKSRKKSQNDVMAFSVGFIAKSNFCPRERGHENNPSTGNLCHFNKAKKELSKWYVKRFLGPWPIENSTATLWLFPGFMMNPQNAMALYPEQHVPQSYLGVTLIHLGLLYKSDTRDIILI